MRYVVRSCPWLQLEIALPAPSLRRLDGAEGDAEALKSVAARRIEIGPRGRTTHLRIHDPGASAKNSASSAFRDFRIASARQLLRIYVTAPFQYVAVQVVKALLVRILQPHAVWVLGFKDIFA